MKAVFFGSPAFAVPCLEVLREIAEIVAVITQPDRPAGRGLKLKAPAVKVRAQELGLKVLQPKKVRSAAFAEELQSLNADVNVVVAYGRILPLEVLQAARCDSVNVHASLLPRWRGAAPINWCIVEGDKITGLSLMKMDEGMDTGPVLAVRETKIAPNETAGELTERLSLLGAELLRETLPRYVAGELSAEAQDEASATLAPLLKKSDGAIDWNQTAEHVHDRVRGMTPWPGAFSFCEGKRFKILRARPTTLAPNAGELPGQVVAVDAEGVLVACTKGMLRITELQQNGRKALRAEQIQAGRVITQGMRFGMESGT